MVPLLGMKYQLIPQHPSIIKYFKGAFKLRPLFPKIFFVWDVQTVWISLGANKKKFIQALSTKAPYTAIGSRRATTKLILQLTEWPYQEKIF